MWSSRSAPSLNEKARERLEADLEIFEQITGYDRDIRRLRSRQKRYAPSGDRYRETEREIERVVGKIAGSIRSLGYAFGARGDVVHLLKNVPCGVRSTEGQLPFAGARDADRPGRFMLQQDPPATWTSPVRSLT